MTRTPFGSIGVFEGTAQKNGSASRARRSGAGAVRRIVRVLPRTVSPAMWAALPAMYAVAPTMSSNPPAAGLLIRGFKVRSIVSLNVWAVTGWFEGGENRKPPRIVNVYVFPSAERVGNDCATSGTSWKAAGPALSG